MEIMPFCLCLAVIHELSLFLLSITGGVALCPCMSDIVLVRTRYCCHFTWSLTCHLLLCAAPASAHRFIQFLNPITPSSHFLSFSAWWLRQQPTALRYSRFSSPPGRGACGRIVLILHCLSSLSFPLNVALLPGETAEGLTVARCMEEG